MISTSTSMRNFNIHSRSDIQVDLAEKLALLQDAVEIRIPPNLTLAKYYSAGFLPLRYYLADLSCSMMKSNFSGVAV